jgi:outer membrane protein TolC
MKNNVFLFFWLIASVLQAQNPESGNAFSLEEAVAYAVKNGYSVRNAATDVEIAKKRVAEIRGIGIPQLSADASFQDFLQVPVSVIEANAFNPAAPPGTFLRIPFGVQYNASYGYTASWLAFSGEYIVGLQAARAYKEVSETQLRKSEIDVREAVTRAFYLVIILNENSRILNENIGSLDESLVQTRAFFREGFIEETDVDRLELVRKNLITTSETLKQQTEIAKNLLKFQMGYPVESPISLKGELNELVTAASAGIAEEPKFDLGSNIDNVLLDQSIGLQKLEIRRQKANYLPTLSTFYSWKESRIANDFSKLNDPLFRVPGGTIWGVNLSMPLFQGFSQSSRVKQANLNLVKLETQKQQALAGLGIQSSQSWTAYSSAMRNLQNTNDARALAQKIYEKTKIKYNEGIGSSLEVIQALNDYLNAQSNYITAVQQLLEARVTIDKNLNKF